MNESNVVYVVKEYVNYDNEEEYVIHNNFDNESEAVAYFEEHKKMYKNDEYDGYVESVVLTRYIDCEWDSEYWKEFYC